MRTQIKQQMAGKHSSHRFKLVSILFAAMLTSCSSSADGGRPPSGPSETGKPAATLPRLEAVAWENPCHYLDLPYLERAGATRAGEIEWVRSRGTIRKGERSFYCIVESTTGDSVTLQFDDCWDDAASSLRRSGNGRELKELDAVEDSKYPGFLYARRGDWCVKLVATLFPRGASHYDSAESSKVAVRILELILLGK
jgi:hypothetical protein